MSDKLMDISPGGETPQYESIQTVTKPTSKSGGDLGEPETDVANSTKGLNEASDRGERTADNVRYGQNISESGMGGMTTSSGGAGISGLSVGDGGESSSTDSAAVETRNEQGYGGDQDMDREIGA